jgi:hypothetical protein
MSLEVTASFVLWRLHALRSFFEAALHHHDDQILNTLQRRLLHYSWAIEIDDQICGSRHGFESGFEASKICGCGAGCVIGDAVIVIFPSDKD